MSNLQKMRFIHYGSTELKEILKQKNKIFSSYLNKPYTGLWASPIGSEYFTWKDWCVGESYRECNEDNSFTFKIKEGSNILLLESREDLYKVKDFIIVESRFTKYFDYDKIMNQYDGILLIHGDDYSYFHDQFSLFEDDDPYRGMFNSWDCDSIVIWNSDAIEVEEKLSGVNELLK